MCQKKVLSFPVRVLYYNVRSFGNKIQSFFELTYSSQQTQKDHIKHNQYLNIRQMNNKSDFSVSYSYDYLLSTCSEIQKTITTVIFATLKCA